MLSTSNDVKGIPSFFRACLNGGTALWALGGKSRFDSNRVTRIDREQVSMFLSQGNMRTFVTQFPYCSNPKTASRHSFVIPGTPKYSIPPSRILRVESRSPLL